MVAWEETMKSLPQNYESQQKKSVPKKKTSGGGVKSSIQVGPKGGGRAVKTGPVITAVNSLAAQNQSILLPQVKINNNQSQGSNLYSLCSRVHPSPEQWPSPKSVCPTASL